MDEDEELRRMIEADEKVPTCNFCTEPALPGKAMCARCHEEFLRSPGNAGVQTR